MASADARGDAGADLPGNDATLEAGEGGLRLTGVLTSMTCGPGSALQPRDEERSQDDDHRADGDPVPQSALVDRMRRRVLRQESRADERARGGSRGLLCLLKLPFELGDHEAKILCRRSRRR